MKKYVIGSAYNKDRSKLVLIKKNRPTWQAGKLNFVGGKLENYDATPLDGIVREFNEETGVFIAPKEWKQFGVLAGPDYEITLFKTFTDVVYNVQTVTDESIRIFDTNAIPFESCIPNLSWLVPMSLETGLLTKDPNYYITEIPEERKSTLKKSTFAIDWAAVEREAEATANAETEVARIQQGLQAWREETRIREMVDYVPIPTRFGRTQGTAPATVFTQAHLAAAATMFALPEYIYFDNIRNEYRYI
jgi:8-oxo-dGTP diphosphatase